MIGYRAGRSPLHRAHPYTPLAVAVLLLCLVFAAGRPALVGLLVAGALAFALTGGVASAVARPALTLALPTWLLLLVLHGLLGDGDRIAIGPLLMSEPGLSRALVLGGRITAIVIAFLTVLAVVSPPRLVEAMTEREAPFSRVYLLVSTLTFVPRLRARAVQVLEAQQCRGLRVGGSPLARLRALGPLVLPLVLGALAEVDQQVLALDTRGVSSGRRRTTMDPPADDAGQWALRWVCVVIVCAAWGHKVLVALRPYGIRPEQVL